MGGEAFLFPLLIIVVVIASVLLAEFLRKMFRSGSNIFVLLAVAFAAPATMLVMALRDSATVWAYAGISIALSAIASCSVAIYYALFRSSE